MDPEVTQDAGVPDYMAEAEAARVEINSEQTGPLAQFSAEEESGEQWRQIGERASELLADLPDYVTEFFGEYRRPIVTVGLILGSIISVKLVLAILASVNDIPLLAPMLELIGLGYSAWFIYRYLLRASNRKELTEDFSALKEQVLGKKASQD